MWNYVNIGHGAARTHIRPPEASRSVGRGGSEPPLAPTTAESSVSANVGPLVSEAATPLRRLRILGLP